MSNLQHRQTKIQDKRKTTPWRDFVMEICSWFPFALYKNNGLITPYHKEVDRVGSIVHADEFEKQRNELIINWTGDLFTSLQKSLSSSRIAGNKVIGKNENCDFSYIVLGASNAYLSIVVVNSQNVLYTYNSFFSSDTYNSILVQNSQKAFTSRIISNSHNIFYSSNINESSNLWFCANMVGCSECIQCDGLNNQSYHINNIPYSQEEYLTIKSQILSQKDGFIKNHHQVLYKKGANIGDNITGSFNKLCNNVSDGLMNYQLQGGRNIVFCNGTDLIEDCSDCCSIGGTQSDNIYASMGVGFDCHHVYCSAECSPQCSNIYYSYLLDTCSFCLGCIGLKNKSYCILNKQYSKEERYQKVDEIFGQMEADGTLGQFFPATMNPFYFNDTAAYLIDPSFTKEEVVSKGYLWRDEPIKVDIPTGADVIKVEELEKYEGWRHMSSGGGTTKEPVDLASEASVSFRASSFQSSEGQQRHIDPSIMKKIIQDPEGNVYRIVPMEYEFLMKHGLPLPRKHWLDRMKENFRIS